MHNAPYVPYETKSGTDSSFLYRKIRTGCTPHSFFSLIITHEKNGTIKVHMDPRTHLRGHLSSRTYQRNKPRTPGLEAPNNASGSRIQRNTADRNVPWNYGPSARDDPRKLSVILRSEWLGSSGSESSSAIYSFIPYPTHGD